MDQSQLSETDKAFFNDGLSLAKNALGEGLKPQKLIQATRQQFDAINELISAIEQEAKNHNVNIDCKKGCEWCCHQPVFATSHEFYFLFKWMKLNFSEVELKTVLQRAFDNFQKRGKLEGEALEKSKMPCPLLQNGSCSAYQARPMACRIYLSMNEASCITFYENPYHATNFPALLEFPLQAGRMMNEGMNEGLRKGNTSHYELLMEEGLLMAHNNGEPIDEKSYKDHPLFK